MRGYMFRNRWFALLFVCITLAGVTKLVGTDKEHGAIQHATDQIAAQKKQAEKLTSGTRENAVSDPPTQAAPYASDEELIDAAVGEDPTPIDAFSDSARKDDEQADTITIVSRDVGAPSPAATQAPAPAN